LAFEEAPVVRVAKNYIFLDTREGYARTGY
jgi:hypothetical protein